MIDDQARRCDRRRLLFWLGASALVPAAAIARAAAAKPSPVNRTDAQWRQALTPAQYRILRLHGTERPHSSALNREHRLGTYLCAADGQRLFRSTAKYDSGTGWPSFTAVIRGAAGFSNDRSLGYLRVEIHCARCGGHLGHVFDDGPRPTGKRFCINGAALRFEAA